MLLRSGPDKEITRPWNRESLSYYLASVFVRNGFGTGNGLAGELEKLILLFRKCIASQCPRNRK